VVTEHDPAFPEREARPRERAESLECQTATAEIQHAIASSPADVQPVFDAIVRNALRACDAIYCSVHRFDGELVDLAAQNHDRPEAAALLARRYPRLPHRGSAVDRAILDRSIEHLVDVRDDPRQSPESLAVARQLGHGSHLVVPMLRDGQPIGAIRVARAVAMPFTDGEIALVQTFAAQAVLAIEGVGLRQGLDGTSRRVER
jgi:GAF domain-containing protein